MVLFGTAVKQFLFCYIFCVVKLLTVAGIFVVQLANFLSVALICGLCLCLFLAFGLGLRVRIWVNGHQKELFGIPPSIDIETVVMALLWPDVREAS